jgi:hypothetical protein
MRTVIIILGGVVLWAVCIGLARAFAHSASGYFNATIAFLVLWLAAATLNMWIGVTQAGYSVQEEFPIFLLIFSLPAIVAVLVKWKFL